MVFGFVISGSYAARTTRHRLAGTVTVDGVPARRLVVLLDRTSFTLIAATVSIASTGSWEIKGIQEYPERSLLVVSLDTSGNYNAETADYISQVTS